MIQDKVKRLSDAFLRASENTQLDTKTRKRLMAESAHLQKELRKSKDALDEKTLQSVYEQSYKGLGFYLKYAGKGAMKNKSAKGVDVPAISDVNSKPPKSAIDENPSEKSNTSITEQDPTTLTMKKKVGNERKPQLNPLRTRRDYGLAASIADAYLAEKKAGKAPAQEVQKQAAEKCGLDCGCNRCKKSSLVEKLARYNLGK